MAKASPTTHVIEIESGIGEPAFIPLSMGQELQPISVGKKGMWRIESPRVLDVHAFVYFDGNSLFVQSADEANGANVDGFRIGKAWTELRAPCTIEVGLARLRYRSLLAEDQATQAAATPPVSPPQPGGAPGSNRPQPGASIPVAVAPAAPGQHLATGPNQPITFPKAERPFKPGEFSSNVDESTRVAPLDAGGGSTGRMGAGDDGQYAGMLQVQGPMAADGPQPAAYGPPPAYDPPPQPHGFEPTQAMLHAPVPPQQPPPYPNQGAYGSMAPQAGQPSPSASPGIQELIAKLKQSLIPMIAAGVLFVIVAILGLVVILGRGSSSSPVDALEGGAMASAPVPPPLAVAPAWPPGVPCPPPNWPQGTPLPCAPNGVTLPVPVDPVKPPPAPAPGAKTLERQAVDFVAAGETGKAAAAYEELVRRDPNNRVYAEAARILRAKVDAGP
jgi:hypothetical protein